MHPRIALSYLCALWFEVAVLLRVVGMTGKNVELREEVFDLLCPMHARVQHTCQNRVSNSVLFAFTNCDVILLLTLCCEGNMLTAEGRGRQETGALVRLLAVFDYRCTVGAHSQSFVSLGGCELRWTEPFGSSRTSAGHRTQLARQWQEAVLFLVKLSSHVHTRSRLLCAFASAVQATAGTGEGQRIGPIELD